MKKTLKILAVIASIISLVIVVLITLAYIYEDEVKEYVLNELNKSLNTAVNVEQVDFTLIDQFPYASLRFTNISADEVSDLPEKNTLFEVEKLYLQFNIFDIINRKYHLKKITVENGTLNLYVDAEGVPNYIFWKSSSDTVSESGFNLALNNVHLENIDVFFKNDIKNMHFSAALENADFSGNFSADNYEMQNTATVFIHRFFENNIQVIRDKFLYIDSRLLVDNVARTYTLQQTELKVQDLTFLLNGKIIEHQEALMLDIESSGENLKIEQLLSLVPPEKQASFKSYSANGNITYSAHIGGMLSHSRSPKITIDFAVNDASLEGPNATEISHINMKGNFMSTADKPILDSKISVENFSGKTTKSYFEGNFKLSGLSRSYASANIKATLDLSEIKEFFKLDTLSEFSGTAQTEIHYKGYLEELKNQPDMTKINASGNMVLRQVVFSFDESTQYTIDTLTAVIDQNRLKINNAQAAIGNNPFRFSVAINHLWQYLADKNQPLNIQADIHSPAIRLDELLRIGENTGDYPENTLHLDFPEQIMLAVTLSADTLLFGKFTARQLVTDWHYSNKQLTVKKADFYTCNGHFVIEGKITQNQQKLFLASGKATLQNVDIHCFFEQMDNFGQTEIVARNIYGQANLNTQFIIPFDTLLHIDTKKLYALNDLEIQKGRLVDYQTIMALSDYIEVEELKDIRFSKLKTQIEIKNEKIIIPKTDIRSSALNVTISGVQGFNSSIDYHFSVLMNDILWRKAKNKNKNTEFGYIAGDGTGRAELFLFMRGTLDDYKIGYDTKELKEKWKQSLRNEKHTIKQILRDEFGWFKKDTTLKDRSGGSEQQDNGLQFEFDQDESPAENNDSGQKKSNNKKKNKDKKGFWDKLTQPNEDEYESGEDIE